VAKDRYRAIARVLVFKQIAAPISSFERRGDRMCEGLLDVVVGMVRRLGCPITKRAVEAVRGEIATPGAAPQASAVTDIGVSRSTPRNTDRSRLSVQPSCAGLPRPVPTAARRVPCHPSYAPRGSRIADEATALAHG